MSQHRTVRPWVLLQAFPKVMEHRIAAGLGRSQSTCRLDSVGDTANDLCNPQVYILYISIHIYLSISLYASLSTQQTSSHPIRAGNIMSALIKTIRSIFTPFLTGERKNRVFWRDATVPRSASMGRPLPVFILEQAVVQQVRSPRG